MHKYYLISNCCAAGDIYKTANIKFNSPFIWNSIDFDNMINLINNLKNINYLNIKLLSKNFECGINIDDICNVWYPHYKYDKKCTNPIVKGIDVFYNLNFKYTAEKYCSRTYRMLKNNYDPFFIIISYLDKINDIQQCVEIQESLIKNNYDSIMITQYKDIPYSNKNKVIQDLDVGIKTAPVPGVFMRRYNISSILQSCI